MAALATAAALLVLGAPGHGAAQGNAALAEEVAQSIPGLQAGLPKQVDEITTWTGIRADGARFVYEMRLPVAVEPERRDALRENLQRLNQSRLCGQAPVATFVRRGGSMRHIYTDAAGNRFETLVAACP